MGSQTNEFTAPSGEMDLPLPQNTLLSTLLGDDKGLSDVGAEKYQTDQDDDLPILGFGHQEDADDDAPLLGLGQDFNVMNFLNFLDEDVHAGESSKIHIEEESNS